MFEVAGFTDAGFGPEELIVLRTPPGRKFLFLFTVCLECPEQTEYLFILETLSVNHMVKLLIL